MIALLLLLATSSPAAADDIAPPPANCPPGARGESSHLGEWCEPHACTSDSSCSPGQVCREAGLCIRTETGTHGQRWGGGPYTRQLVEGGGTCDACSAPATCTRAKYCYPREHAPASSPPTTTPATGSQPPAQPMDRVILRGVDDEDDGCRATGVRGPAAGLGLALGIAALALALTRRRR